MHELALFAGAGGGILGGLLLGWRTVCAVEIDPYCRDRLMQRQDEGHLQPFPIWDDVRTFDGKSWRGCVDVVSGGFPCQDISSAGRGAGLGGRRSGLWFEMLRIIEEVRPRFAFIENSPNLRTRGLVTVLQGLARAGYDAEWCVLGADQAGAPHKRRRMWILAADTNDGGERVLPVNAKVARAQADTGPLLWWPDSVCAGVDDGVAHRMERVRATGNGQVPGVAAMAWRLLREQRNGRT